MATIIDGTYMYHDALRRISELEKLSTGLAEQVDRMRPVVKAAQDMKEHGCGQCEADLDRTVATYEQQMAQLAGERMG